MRILSNNLLSKFKTLGLFIFILLFGATGYSQDQVRILNRNGLFSSSFTVEVPTNSDGTNPQVIVSRRTEENGSSNLFIATGLQNTVKPASKPEVITHPKLKFRELHLLVDGSGKRIAAAYPLQQNRQILIASLHALQNTRFENANTNSLKRWGLQDRKTGKLLDVAFITGIEDAQVVKSILSAAVETEDMISNGYADHLNVVDQHGELMLSRSDLQINSSNEKYIFYKNSQDSLIGYASSGAIIYNQKNNKAHSIVTCASKVPLNAEESVIRNRALMLNTILHYQFVELTTEMINSFENLSCESQDGSSAGGH